MDPDLLVEGSSFGSRQYLGSRPRGGRCLDGHRHYQSLGARPPNEMRSIVTSVAQRLLSLYIHTRDGDWVLTFSGTTSVGPSHPSITT